MKVYLSFQKQSQIPVLDLHIHSMHTRKHCSANSRNGNQAVQLLFITDVLSIQNLTNDFGSSSRWRHWQMTVLWTSFIWHTSIGNCTIVQWTLSQFPKFLADGTNGRAHATMLRLSCATLCIVAKWCNLEQKLLLKASAKSYMRNQ